MVKFNSELNVATKTNTPSSDAYKVFNEAVDKATKQYLDTYYLRAISNEIISRYSGEYYTLVFNRVANFVNKGIENGTITKASDVSNLRKGNLQMKPDEEKAIIVACHEGEEDAILMAQIFFSFKVLDFMKRLHLSKCENSISIFEELQLYIPELVANFDFIKVANGGLCPNYYNQFFLDTFRREIIGKKGLVSMGKRTAGELNILKRAFGAVENDYELRKLVEEEDNKLNTVELAKKYGVSKNSVILFFSLKGSFSADEIKSNEEGDMGAKGDTIADTMATKKMNDVLIPILYTQFYATFEKMDIPKETTTSILNGVLNYKEIHNERVKISEREKKELSDEINVPVKIINLVLKEFGDTFADVI